MATVTQPAEAIELRRILRNLGNISIEVRGRRDRAVPCDVPARADWRFAANRIDDAIAAIDSALTRLD